MIDEPRIALAASPREWAQKLHRHVADHGGARVRATVLHPRDAMDEDHDVLVADDTTSFLTPRLVEALHALGRGVLGVYDPQDPRGREDLLAIGVDSVLPRDAAPEEFVDALVAVARARGRSDDRAEGATGTGDGAASSQAARPDAGDPGGAGGATGQARRGTIVAVAGSSGGAGATEVAVALAAACGARQEPVVVVDADDVSPSLAARLRLPVYPNLRAVVDAVEQRTAAPTGMLVAVHGGRFWALPGIGSPANWNDLRPARTIEALRLLAAAGQHVVVNVGHRVEDVPTPGGIARYGLARHVVSTADAVVVVASGSPAGLARLLDWVAETRGFAPEAPLHVVCNRAPAHSFARAEMAAEITRAFAPRSLWFAPADARVEAAAWRQEVVTTGPFVKAVTALAAATVPMTGGRARRRRRASPWTPWRRTAA